MAVRASVGLGIGGLLPLMPGVQEKIKRVVVDTHVHKPDMFEIVFDDEEGSVVVSAHIEVGTEIWIKGGAEDDTVTETLIAGEVTSIEGIYENNTIQTVVRGYEKAHRMQRVRRTRTWTMRTDSVIALEIAAQYKLLPTGIETTTVVHEHVAQMNQTDWDFLKQRAFEIGYEVGVSQGALFFRKPPGLGALGAVAGMLGFGAPKLAFRDNLLSFRPRIASAGLVPNVEVRVWDPKNADVIVGKASVASKTKSDPPPPSTPGPYSAPRDLAAKFPPGGLPALPSIPGLSLGPAPGNDAFVVSNRPIAGLGLGPAKPAIDAVASGLAEHIGSTWAEAEGVATGSPKIQAGESVIIEGVAAEFAGSWYVTNARHVFDLEENGYTTRFIVSGRQDRSLLGLTSLGASQATAAAPTMHGLVCGVVSNVFDLEQLGRVKVAFPWLSPGYESDWARVLQFGAGKGQGSTFLPEVGDEVLVGFEFGDARRPYVLGGLVNKNSDLDFGGAEVGPMGMGGKVIRRGIVTRAGKLVFDDDPFPTGLGTSGIKLTTKNEKQGLTIDQKAGTIELICEPAPPESTSPMGKVTIRVNNAGTINIEAGSGGTVNIKAGTGGTMTIDGGAALTLKGNTVKIEGTGPVEVSGKPIKLN